MYKRVKLVQSSFLVFLHLHVGIGHSGEITRVKISPDGKHMVSVSADGVIIRWKLPYNITTTTNQDQLITDQQQHQHDDTNRSLVEQTEHMSIEQGDNNEGEEVANSQRVESPQVAVD